MASNGTGRDFRDPTDKFLAGWLTTKIGLTAFDNIFYQTLLCL